MQNLSCETNTYAFITVRGNIHLEFLPETVAREVFETSEPTFLGNQSTIRRANEIEKPNETVITKRESTDINNSEMALLLPNYHSFGVSKLRGSLNVTKRNLKQLKSNLKQQ